MSTMSAVMHAYLKEKKRNDRNTRSKNARKEELKDGLQRQQRI